jgi:hypothetical protein
MLKTFILICRAAPFVRLAGRQTFGLCYGGSTGGREEVQIRQATCDLDELDDRTLKDLGFQRSEIEYRSVEKPGFSAISVSSPVR